MSRNTVLLTMMAALLTATESRAASRMILPVTSEGGFADIVEKALPGVARVIAGAGEGSAVVISADGYLLTNRHVVAGAPKITVQLSDERQLPAQVVAADGPTDLAVLKVEAADLQPVPFGDSSRVRIGDYALAIGNPFGVGTTVTLGIVSAKGEGDYIQTDAAINPGNSGGPLLNIRGELIGINTAIISASGGSNGVGFALPSNLARAVSGELTGTGHVTRGYLGAAFQPVTDTLREALGVNRGGALVTDIAPGSPAANAGLLKGDVLVAINGRMLRDFRRLQLQAAQAKPNTEMRMTVARQDTEVTLTVMLGERPESGSPAAAVAEDILPGAAISEAGANGPVVAGVDPQGASAEAGLRAGDVIVAVNRKSVANTTALREGLSASLGKPVLLEISREGSTFFFALAR